MSFAVFDELIYLYSYRDVLAAYPNIFKSGLDHFQQFGLKEGRVRVSPFYDEEFYLQRNPDVAAAVRDGVFSSGLEHFILFGEAEGRNGSLYFDEEGYLARNPDVAAAVRAGAFTSGLQHYILVGQDEGRRANPTPFNEFGYLEAYPDVKAAVINGTFGSGLEHYVNIGQVEGRTAIFNGTGGNDTVIGFGQLDTLYGVDLSPGPEELGATPTGGQSLNVYSYGINEVDVLIGGGGKDTFVLGRLQIESKIPPAVTFYRGNGNADFARIENFEIGKDEIVLAGAAYNYDFVESGDNLNIFLGRTGYANNPLPPLPSPDLIATVQGVTSLSEIESSLQFTGSYLG